MVNTLTKNVYPLKKKITIIVLISIFLLKNPFSEFFVLIKTIVKFVLPSNNDRWLLFILTRKVRKRLNDHYSRNSYSKTDNFAGQIRFLGKRFENDGV